MSHPAELDKSLYAGIMPAGRVYNSATETKECQLAKNKARCSCPDKDCVRNGACCECVAYHRDCGDVPMCLRKNRR